MYILLTTLSILSSAHAADGYNAHGFTLVPSDNDQADLLTVWSPERQLQGKLGAEALFEYADQPLVEHHWDGAWEDTVKLDQLFGSNLGLSYGVSKRVGLAASLPVWFYASDEAGESSPTLGDLRLSAPIGLVMPDEDDGGFGLSVVPFVSAPTGNDDRYLGSGEFSGGANLAAGWTSDRWQLSANAGLEQDPDVNIVNLRGGLFYRAAVGASYGITETLALRGEFELNSTVADEVVERAETPSEVLVSLRGHTKSDLVWTVGGAKSVINGAGAAKGRVFVGLGMTFGDKHEDHVNTLEIVAIGPDGERVNALARFVDGHEGTPARQLGDDGFTQMHVDPGMWTVDVSYDGDSIQESASVPEDGTGRITVHFGGKPPPPPPAHDFCNKPVPFDNVNFAFDEWQDVLPQSYPILAQIGSELNAQLAECPEKTIEIGGHTDSVGPDFYNVWLSRQRMNTVKKILVEQYKVDGSRLTVYGYGESQLKVPVPTPEACALDNDTPEQIAETNQPEGRCAKNRRVEFTPHENSQVASRR